MNAKQQDKIDALSIACILIQNYLSGLDRTDDSPALIIELERIQARLEREKQRLINPTPRKPKQTEVKEYNPVPMPVEAIGTPLEIAIPEGLQHTVRGSRSGKNGRNK